MYSKEVAEQSHSTVEKKTKKDSSHLINKGQRIKRLMDDGKFSEAEQVARQELACDPKNEFIESELITVLLINQKLLEAGKHAWNLYNRDSEGPFGLYNLNRSYMAQGWYQDVEYLSKKSLDKRPFEKGSDQEAIIKQLIASLRRQKKSGEAKHWTTKALQIDPDNKDFKVLLNKVLFEESQQKKTSNIEPERNEQLKKIRE